MFDKIKEFAAKPIVRKIGQELAIAVAIVVVTTIVRVELTKALEAAHAPKEEIVDVVDAPLDDQIG